MARSVTEMLPRSFDALDAGDLARIVSDAGDPPESIVLELKRQYTDDALGKAVAAFANTIGGLLLIGVDDRGDVVGVEPAAPEAQVWVKDKLRALVSPMPPFRARWISTFDERAVLAVIVEESSTTPHIHTRRGAVYVRNPGSSDPLTDQATLFTLIHRGEDARSAAEGLAVRLATEEPRQFDRGYVVAVRSLAVAATGRRVEYRDRMYSSAGRGRFRDAAARIAGVPPDVLPMGIRQNTLDATHAVHGMRSHSGVWIETDTSGAFRVREGFKLGSRVGPIERDVWQCELTAQLSEAQETLLDYGAHGDLHIVLFLTSEPRTLMVGPDTGSELAPGRISARRWASIGTDSAQVIRELLAEVTTAAGLPPDC